jgi:hypothetical protein
LVEGRQLIHDAMQYFEPFLGIRQPNDQESGSSPYLPAVLGILLVAIIGWFVITKTILGPIIASSVLFAIWLSLVNLRFGFAGLAAALPTVIFFVILFLYPIRHRVGSDFFSVTAQIIPVLFIAFAIESGVVRNRTRTEVKMLALILAILLSWGEAAALLGLAAGEKNGFSNAEVWHVTMAVAALAAGFLSIIISMLLREPDEMRTGPPADNGAQVGANESNLPGVIDGEHARLLRPAVVARRLRVSRPQPRNVARRISIQRRLATANYQARPKAAHKRPHNART